MPLKPDDTILNGKYHIVRLIAKGGMARVWLAEEPRFGNRRVAIKEPRTDLLPELAQEVRLRYRREVQVCAALDKARTPHIVRAITTELLGDTLLLVMEYMPGGDLASMMEEHPDGLPVERVVGIALDLLAALEGVHAHKMEIVHRDVKPSNVLFDEQGRAHLADFGLAQLAGMSGRSQLAGGQHPGTPMYMAPEQESSPRTLTPAADLYAVGCLLFEMLMGTRYKRVRPGTLPGALRAEVPRGLDGVVAKALAEDPWERYAEAAEMAAAIGEAEERARAQAAEEARRREAEERARVQAAEEARRREAEERARVQAAEEARRREAEELARARAQAAEETCRREEERRPAPERRGAAAQAPRRSERPAWFWPAVGVAGVLVIAVAVALVLLFGGGTGGAETQMPEPTQLAVVEPTATASLTATDAATATDTPETPTSTSTPTDTPRPIASQTPSSTPTMTRSPTATSSAVPTATATQVSASQPTASSSLAGGERRLAVPYGINSLYVIDVATGSESQITWTFQQAEAVRSAVWSPDGRLILVGFEYYVGGIFPILRTMNADGSNWKDLINSRDGGPKVTGAVWSPDGRAIAMRYQSGSDFGVWIANSDGTGLRALDSTSIADYPRFWSVDGVWVIAVCSDDSALYALEVDGNRRIPLAQLGGIQVYDQRYYPWRITDQPSCDYWSVNAFFDCQ